MKHDPQYTIAAYGCFIWTPKNFDTFLKNNKYDLHKGFPQRKPLAGWYDDTQQAFDKHLQSMADCALDVMVIDWYPVNALRQEKHKALYDQTLNNGTQFFMASKLDVPVKFCLTLINHEPFVMKTDRDWETSTAKWLKAFKHPRYWKIDGKPVFTIHSSWHLDQQQGSPEKSAQRLNTLRKRVQQAGMPGIIIAAGIHALPRKPGNDQWIKKCGYDFITFYNMPNCWPYRDQLSKDKDFILPYRQLMDAHFAEWAEYLKQKITTPFSPFITAHWDPKPSWGMTLAHMIRYEEPADDEFREFFTHAKNLMDASAYYRIPTKDGKGIKAIFICAWNELTEGSIICPTVGHGHKRMKMINQVFSKK